MVSKPFTCDCCNHQFQIEPNKVPLCHYCGCRYAFATSNDINQETAQAHKEEVLDRITDISINLYRYAWNQRQGRFELIKQEKTPPVSARKIFNTPIRLKEVGHIIHDDGTTPPIDVSFSYQFNQSERQSMCKLTPKPDLGEWSFAMAMNDNLQLVFYIGIHPEKVLEEGTPCDLFLW